MPNANSRTDRKTASTKTLKERDDFAKQALASRYEALNQAFLEAEARLRDLKPIRTVHHAYNHDDSATEHGGPSSWELLAIMKYNDKWRIVHGKDDDFNDEPAELKPISERPVEVRVRAAVEVPELYIKIIEEKEKYVPVVEEAIQTLNDFCKK